MNKDLLKNQLSEITEALIHLTESPYPIRHHGSRHEESGPNLLLECGYTPDQSLAWSGIMGSLPDTG